MKELSTYGSSLPPEVSRVLYERPENSEQFDRSHGYKVYVSMELGHVYIEPAKGIVPGVLRLDTQDLKLLLKKLHKKP